MNRAELSPCFTQGLDGAFYLAMGQKIKVDLATTGQTDAAVAGTIKSVQLPRVPASWVGPGGVPARGHHVCGDIPHPQVTTMQCL